MAGTEGIKRGDSADQLLAAGGAGDGRLSTTSPASEQSDPAVTVGSGEGVEGEGVDGRALPMEDEEEEEGKLLPEKLPEDDAMRPPFYLRAIYTVFPALQKIEERRLLKANDDAYNSPFKYAKNRVITSKYNIITFLPRNLFEQFLRVANIYFLFLLIIQLIPGVASVPFYSTLIPLVGVLLITAVKDAYDDIKRHISDHKINNRIAHVLRNGMLLDVAWDSVRVGDVLRLERDDFITADMLLLSSSEPNSLVYIETAELDGETNLKVRQPLPETADLADDLDKLGKFCGEVECEPPNNRLNKFVGTASWDTHTFALDNDKILLRGCRLRNTKWMYGLVIYAGHDTKLVQNSGRTKFKRTHLDHRMNKMVIFILGLLLVCIAVCVVGSGVFEGVYGVLFRPFAPYQNKDQDTPAEIAFLQILSNIVVLNTFVPISLYVSVEAIRLGLSLLINWDRKMYYEEEDVPAIARTTTLNEELGQIEYIFSDKTGTLTQNKMTFLKCSIRGARYGEVRPEYKPMEQEPSTGAESQRQLSTSPENDSADPPQIDFSQWNKHAEPEFVYYDQEFVDKCRSRDKDCDDFMKALALCHTVLPTMETGTLSYNAQSPDEAALVSAARNFGYVFRERTPFAAVLDILNLESEDKEAKFEVLNILDFNNERKRMSVIVKSNDQITLYCKGADSVVLARLDPKLDTKLKKLTQHHLVDYAREGLRTLVVAKKDLSEVEYTLWLEKQYAASILQENRDEELDRVYNEIEQNLVFVGATAIEDKLQDGVPETIANLARANIKIWVLTGDKQETAINIGYSCKLLTEEMRVFIVDEDTREGVVGQLRDTAAEMDKCDERQKAEPFQQDIEDDDGVSQASVDPLDNSKLGPPYGIVLNGHSLRYALKEEVKQDLLDTASRCKAVICCRVTPLQKKRVVDLVKKRIGAVSLAIGDGANDVGMIKAAHIGVGISGREGQQAVLSSDYSFGQFRYLERLLLVHGRWSYHRMTTFLRYFFYKNFAFTFSQFIFAFFCGFTAQTLYDPTYIAVYNVIYTSLPVVALAILDQDVSESDCYRFPQLYIAGQQNKNFNNFIFFRSLMKGIYVAIAFFFMLFGMTAFNQYPSGYEWDYQSYSLAASGALTIIVNLQIALDTFHWNPVMHVFVWGSILAWFVVLPITSAGGLYGTFFEYAGVFYEVLGSATFWFYWPLATAVALLPTVIFRSIRLDLDPHLVDDVRLKAKKEGPSVFKRLKIQRKPAPEQATVASPEKVVPRSGYAFSHKEGFGEMISTGHIFGMDEDEVQAQHRERVNTYLGSSRPGSMYQEKRSDLAATAMAAAGAVTIAVVEPADDDKPGEEEKSEGLSTAVEGLLSGGQASVESEIELDVMVSSDETHSEEAKAASDLPSQQEVNEIEVVSEFLKSDDKLPGSVSDEESGL